MRADVFQHAAGEIAHVDQRGLGQDEQLLHGGLGGGAGGAGDVVEAGALGDIDAAMDGMNPGRAGVRHDNAGGAENGQAADDAEPGIQGALGDPLAAGDGDFDDDIGCAGRRHRGADHLARRGIDGWFARRQGQAGPGDGADAGTGAELHAASRRPMPHCRHDQRAMGDIGIVAGVLDDSRAGETFAGLVHCQGEGRALPAGQVDRHRIGEHAAQQRLAGRARGCGSAGAGGPAPAQCLVWRRAHGCDRYRAAAVVHRGFAE